MFCCDLVYLVLTITCRPAFRDNCAWLLHLPQHRPDFAPLEAPQLHLPPSHEAIVLGSNDVPHKGPEVLAGFLVDVAERQRRSGKSGSRTLHRLS
jgi:hypothetical protein